MNITDKIPQNKQLILFDGVCNFCDKTIQKAIKADKNNVFVFPSLQSELGQEILKYIGVDSSTDSIVLYQPNVAYYIESDAVIEIAKHLSGIYPLLQAGKILPKIVRNKMYRYVASNRYKWYGKKEECVIPLPEIRSKFLS
mgnify:CR=1 FL=1